MKFATRRLNMGTAALALGAGVFLSRILGLVRDKVISYYFGAGPEADIYFAAFVVPDFLGYLLAGGYFSVTLVPLLASAFHQGEESGRKLFSAAVCWSFTAIFLLTLAAWWFAPELAAVAAPGFEPPALARLSHFLRIILPAQVFFLPGACFTALLYYRRQFTVPVLSPLIYNGGIIICGFIGLHLSPAGGMEGFCWGVLVGSFLGSFLMPALAVRAGGPAFKPNFRHPMLKTLLLLALPLMLGQSIVALDEQFVRIFGSLTGDGGVSLLNYARRIMLVPVGVVAQAAGVASFPFLASLAASGDKPGFDLALNRAIRSTVLVALPVSLGLAATAEPVMRLIFQQGDFTAEAATTSGVLLAVMLLGVAFWSAQQLISRSFYAHKDTLTPALAGTGATILALPLYYFGAERLGALGVALAGTLGVVLYLLILSLVRIRRHGPEGTAGLLRLGLICLAFCLPAAGAAWVAQWYAGTLLSGVHHLWRAFWQIVAGGCAFLPVYLGLGRIFAPRLLEPLLLLLARAMGRAGNEGCRHA